MLRGISIMTESRGGSSATIQRRAKLARLKELGTDPYPARSRRSHRNEGIHEQFMSLAPGESSPTAVHVAGSVMAIRNGGMFIDVNDGTEKLQLYFDVRNRGEDWKRFFDTLDIGDIIGASGVVRRTKRGELTVDV